MTQLTILILATIALSAMLIISFFLGYKYDTLQEAFHWIGGVGLFLIIMFGWLAVGLGRTIYTKTLKVDGEISISRKSITVDDYQRNFVYYFDKKIDFDNISDTTTIYLKQNFNMYNNESGINTFYEIDNIKYWGKILKTKKL